MPNTKQRVGITFSAFDLLHAGHILMLQEAKETYCDYLVACLHSDPTLDRPTKNKPIQTLEERYIQLSAVKYVDEIRIYDWDAEVTTLLDEIRPHVRIIGDDYKNLPDFTAKSFCEENNIKIVYHSRSDHSWSTSELRKRIADVGK